MRTFSLIFSLLLIFILCACRKDKITTSAADKLSFSTDTLTFDTVFTTLGSDTRYFKIFNPHSKSIKISSLKLGGGNQSYFRLNVDGIPTKTELNDLEIAPHDSMYVFAAVTIDPSAANNPFIVEDSVEFETNGNTQKVLLFAYGQNAHFQTNHHACNETWNPDKPYVIFGNLTIDPGCTLTINPGCRIYLHAGSTLDVFGTLNVLGTPHDSIIFRGDRLEYYFVDLPGNWTGILFEDGSQGRIENAVIKEAVNGVYAYNYAGTSHVSLKQTHIRYCLSTGILGLNASLSAENCLVNTCGERCVDLELGGHSVFTNCTFAEYSNAGVGVNHQKALFRCGNYIDLGSLYYLQGLNDTFRNCILDGGLDEEMSQDSSTHAGAIFNLMFDHCFLKTKHNTATGAYASCTVNIDPLFRNTGLDDYHLQTSSPCKDGGVLTGLSSDLYDLDNYARNGMPDIGCYEAH